MKEEKEELFRNTKKAFWDALDSIGSSLIFANAFGFAILVVMAEMYIVMHYILRMI